MSIDTLTHYVQTHKQDARFLQTFQATGQQYLGDALQVLTSPSPDAAAASRAIHQLKDLRAAALASLMTTRDLQEANAQANSARVRCMNTLKTGVRAETVREPLKDFTAPDRALDMDGKAVTLSCNQSPLIRTGVAIRGPETATLTEGVPHDMAAVKQFAQDVTRLITYMTATTMPGPMGQALALSSNAQAGASVSGHWDSDSSASLGVLGGVRHLASSSHGEVAGSYGASAEATAVRVSELLDDLHTRLAGASIQTPPPSTITATSGKTLRWDGTFLGFPVHGSKKYLNTHEGGSTRTLQDVRIVDTPQHQPPHIDIPVSAFDVFGAGYFSGEERRFDVNSL